MADALILAGAVAKGAWTSGVLRELTDPSTQARLGLDIRRIVATSSGSINGAYLAAHLRDGSEAAAMPLLEELWLELGDFKGVFDVSARALLSRRGISTSKKVRALLEQFIAPNAGTRPIELAVVVTNMDGEVDLVGSELATTYERCLRFHGDVFDDAGRLELLFDAVVASAAFPVLFEPARVALGMRDVQCVDGGVTNNTPIKYALEGPGIDRVFVIAPFPSVAQSAPNLRGTALLFHLAEMLVAERIFRDTREAQDVNRALRALEHALPLRSLRERALAAIGWEGRRVIDIVEVRPYPARRITPHRSTRVHASPMDPAPSEDPIRNNPAPVSFYPHDPIGQPSGREDTDVGGFLCRSRRSATAAVLRSWRAPRRVLRAAL